MSRTSVSLKSFESFPDGSGAPALIECDGFTFSCDCLGTPRFNNITGGNRKPSKRVLNLVKWFYGIQLKSLGAAWHQANREMYAEG